MPKTVLITGASTGIGYETAKRFQQQGWNVVATMRSPEKVPELATLANVVCLKLDVTDLASIQAGVAAALQHFQTIDVLVNNAGYGLIGPFEACSREELQRQFDTNVFGLMDVTRALLPHFREQRSGVIINVASVGGHITIPLYSPYHATKWAVEGFSESLQYELEPFNIRVKLIEPGPIKTDFYSRSKVFASQPGLTAYDEFIARVKPAFDQADTAGSPPSVTADIIYQAAIADNPRLRYPAGGNASAILFLRKLLPDAIFHRLIRLAVVR
ncbi:MAG: SDR family oxidoreductase [Leptolyngbyaceae cyanobacterium bins.349]|nr:SDR family oxidoreductase [Leptolyngbyaceae cyanobacterium bins.349]